MTEWGIDTLFNPGKRHMDEEKRRLQSTREEIGDSSGGRRIDLESGTVRISRPGKAPVAPNETAGDETAADETAGNETAGDGATTNEVAGDEEAGVELARERVEAEKAAESVDQTARVDGENAEAPVGESGSSKPGD